ncbi:uncharacterized protein LOC129905048 [Solanum dulcamara]|uniref:uncharacterized protein LOC129905048 n=1 Tax=Solanum dulcamara TaxID=45834 RepID=UPI002484ECCA|nr:uncharacterized protein LOC129905048 [Solanum dulcamara]
MSGYAKFMKDVITNKRMVSFQPVDNLHHCIAIATRSLVKKKEDLDAFTIPFTIGVFNFAKAFCDLGANRTVKKLVGIIYDILVKVESFIFLADFIILDCEVDFDILIILDRLFLATKCGLVDMQTGQLKFLLNNKKVIFDICREMKHHNDLQVVSIIDVVDNLQPEIPIK